MSASAARRPGFGPAALDVPPVGQGTWNVQRAPERAADALRYGVSLGLTHIDTAEVYGGGAVESLVGRALRGLRERVVLVSKVDPARATRRGLVEACEESLCRLRTDRIDVYLLHWLPPHPLEECVAGFEDLVAAGKIRYWGVSNFDEVKLAELLELSDPGSVCCNQVMHHLGERSIEARVVPFCRDRGIAVVGYSPFGAGAFPPTPEGGRALEEAAEAAGVTPRQAALAFLLHKSGGYTIAKASRREHVEENAAAAGVVLPEEALERLDAAFPADTECAGIPTW